MIKECEIIYRQEVSSSEMFQALSKELYSNLKSSFDDNAIKDQNIYMEYESRDRGNITFRDVLVNEKNEYGENIFRLSIEMNDYTKRHLSQFMRINMNIYKDGKTEYKQTSALFKDIDERYFKDRIDEHIIYNYSSIIKSVKNRLKDLNKLYVDNIKYSLKHEAEVNKRKNNILKKSSINANTNKGWKQILAALWRT